MDPRPRLLSPLSRLLAFLCTSASTGECADDLVGLIGVSYGSQRLVASLPALTSESEHPHMND